MGSIVASNKQQQILKAVSTIQKYQKVGSDDYGNELIKINNKLCISIIKQLSQTNQNMLLMEFKKIQKIHFNHLVNIYSFNCKVQTIFCSSTINLQSIFEYEQANLSKKINQFRTSMYYNSKNDQKSFLQSNLEQLNRYSYTQIINLFKFMIEATEQIIENNFKWPIFHIKSILINQKGKLIFTNYYFQNNLEQYQRFFSPEHYVSQENKMESSTVFSIGMVLLCLFINQQCSDCYNFQNLTFCQSILEQKLQVLFQTSFKKKYNRSFDNTSNETHIQDEIKYIISQLLSVHKERPSFDQTKRMYINLIKKISLNIDKYNKQAISQSRKQKNNQLDIISNQHRSLNSMNLIKKTHFFSTNQNLLDSSIFTQLEEDINAIKDNVEHENVSLGIKINNYTNQLSSKKALHLVQKRKCQRQKKGKENKNF